MNRWQRRFLGTTFLPSRLMEFERNYYHIRPEKCAAFEPRRPNVRCGR
jgi:hypothetical protein